MKIGKIIRQNTLDPPEITWEQDNSDQLQSIDKSINSIAQSLSEASSQWVETEESLRL